MRSRKWLDRCHSILDLRDAARHRLPRPIFDMMDGGAETESTLRRNTTAFDDVMLIPRCLIDVGCVDTSTRVLGQDIQWPVFCSPTGGSRLFHPDGELAVARAAAKSGTLYGLSTFSTRSIEEVARASDGPKLFQLYIGKNRDLTRSLIERAKRAGYAALCVTVDTQAIGKVERDLRARVTHPPRDWPLSTVLGFARRPLWGLKHLYSGAIVLANLVSEDGTSPAGGAAEQLSASITWRDIREVAALWGGPFALKGVISADDARRAADEGVTACIVSNHGGRQLDGTATPIEVLPEIVRAVGDRMEVVLDGGVRRGTHVLKALACGAKACSIGRPYLYGLSAGGQAGVAKALDILRKEFVLAMTLSGCPNIASIDRHLIRIRRDLAPV